MDTKHSEFESIGADQVHAAEALASGASNGEAASTSDTFADVLHIEFTHDDPERVEAIMPILPQFHQPFGYVHGGVTLALLETVASRGAHMHCDMSKERPFGVEIDVRHRKSAQSGHIRGVAELDHEEPSKVSGMKQYWNVRAYDDAGDVMSEGIFVTKVVSLEHLAKRKQNRGQ